MQKKLYMFLATAVSLTCGSAYGIEEDQVLVIYNSEQSDSQEVRDYYLTKRTGVLSFDLDDSSLVPGNISYADFASKIRNPIRNHLNSNNLEEAVHVLVLTKGLPHRIQSLDTSIPNIGDDASASETDYDNGNANFASVDSELTLLQFNLESNENGESMDSVADQAVTNPYFDQNDRFDSYSRSNIGSSTLTFQRQGPYNWWRLNRPFAFIMTRPANPGHIYLTARLDASTVAEVKAMIDRAQNITFRKDLDAILLDADARLERLDTYTDPFNGQSSTDYSEATSTLAADWPQLLHDETATFLVGASSPIAYADTTVISGPIAHLHSYGVNHTGSNSQIRDYLATFSGQLPSGASFSAYESFGATGLGGLSNNGQAQVEEWITAGGTFATGPVWEPFTFGISKSEIFLDRFFNQGFTYVEAAWCSILQLSWQSVVLGDPLATVSFVDATPYERWAFDQIGSTPYVNFELGFASDFELDGLANGLEYIFGLDPTSSEFESNKLPAVSFENPPQTIDFVLDPVSVDNVLVEVEMSTTLNENSWVTIALRTPGDGWTGSATIQENVSAEGLDVSVTDNVPGPTTKRFYRVSGELAPVVN